DPEMVSGGPLLAEMRRLCAQLGLPTIEIERTDGIIRSPAAGRDFELLELSLSESDRHPNRAGHAVYADAIFQAIQRDLLPELGFEVGRVLRGNTILRELTGKGLHESERWGDRRLNWTQLEGSLQFE